MEIEIVGIKPFPSEYRDTGRDIFGGEFSGG